MPAPPDLPAHLLASLHSARVPLVSLSECAACTLAAECYDFDVDLDSQMCGSSKPFGRIALLATARENWPHTITDPEKGLAFPALLDKHWNAAQMPPGQQRSIADGVYQKGNSHKLSILACSMLNQHEHDDDNHASLIILPDFKIVTGVPTTPEGASQLVSSHLSSSIPLPASPSLPYSALILLCSHKNRDKRCHISAPLLVDAFHHSLHAAGFEIDERGDDLLHPFTEQTVGLFKVSHIGGHRYAGNCIIYLPSGAGVWYGRVEPSMVDTIVQETIVKGRVIRELLRGAVGIDGKQSSIYEW